jgi:hypothetical protein
MQQLCLECNKISHPGRATAGMQAARTLSFAAHRELDLYKCPHGNGWHAGHNRKTRKRPPVHEYRRSRLLTLPPQALAKEYVNYA